MIPVTSQASWESVLQIDDGVRAGEWRWGVEEVTQGEVEVRKCCWGMLSKKETEDEQMQWSAE